MWRRLVSAAGVLGVVLACALSAPVRAAADEEPVTPTHALTRVEGAIGGYADVVSAQAMIITPMADIPVINQVHQQTTEILQRSIWMDNRLQALQADTAALKTAVANVQTTANSAKTHAANADQRSVWIDNRVQGLEKSTATIKTDAAAAKKNAADAYQRTVWIDGKVTDLQTAVAGLASGTGGSGGLTNEQYTGFISRLDKLVTGGMVGEAIEWIKGIKAQVAGIAERCPEPVNPWWAIGVDVPTGTDWCDPTQEDVRRAVDKVTSEQRGTTRAIERLEDKVAEVGEAAAAGDSAIRDEIVELGRSMVEQVQGLVVAVQASAESAARAVSDSISGMFALEAYDGGAAAPLTPQLNKWLGDESPVMCLAPEVAAPGSLCGAGPVIDLLGYQWRPLSYCGDVSSVERGRRIVGLAMIVMCAWACYRSVVAAGLGWYIGVGNSEGGAA